MHVLYREQYKEFKGYSGDGGTHTVASNRLSYRQLKKEKITVVKHGLEGELTNLAIFLCET